jgi:7-cyano-7-deazaguanine synthase
VSARRRAPAGGPEGRAGGGWSRAVALLSGGLDSVVAASLARERGEIVLAITFDYGQKAAPREAAAARAVARALGARWRRVALPWLRELVPAAVSRGGRSLPRPRPRELDDRALSEARARAVWVPNRNGVFVNVAASYAEGLGADALVAGFNSEEAISFPDNSAEYLRRATAALELSTLSGVRVVSPTAGLVKCEIVREGLRLGSPLERVWSCYEGGRSMCGSCEGCMRLLRALAAGGAPREKWPRALRGARPRRGGRR